MDITQEEYRVTKQQGRIIHTKINILNFQLFPAWQGGF